MSPEQKTKANDILRDAADPEIRKQKVLHAMSVLGGELGGDARHALVEEVYARLAQRDHDPGNHLFVRGKL
jgi:hypothetical protein